MEIETVAAAARWLLPGWIRGRRSLPGGTWEGLLLSWGQRPGSGGVRHSIDFGTCVLSQDGSQERKVDALGKWKAASAHTLWIFLGMKLITKVSSFLVTKSRKLLGKSTSEMMCYGVPKSAGCVFQNCVYSPFHLNHSGITFYTSN